MNTCHSATTTLKCSSWQHHSLLQLRWIVIVLAVLYSCFTFYGEMKTANAITTASTTNCTNCNTTTAVTVPTMVLNTDTASNQSFLQDFTAHYNSRLEATFETLQTQRSKSIQRAQHSSNQSRPSHGNEHE